MREDGLVQEAAVVGVDRSIPGLLVFCVDGADSMSDEAYLDASWQSVADANSRAEAFSQVTKDMIKLLTSNINYSPMDKENIIRAQLYDRFSAQIEEMYTRLDNTEGSPNLDLPALEDYLTTAFQNTVGVSLETLKTDFFTASMDSLKAIQMRQMIQKSLSLNTNRLSANVIYEKANVKNLGLIESHSCSWLPLTPSPRVYLSSPTRLPSNRGSIVMIHMILPSSTALSIRT